MLAKLKSLFSSAEREAEVQKHLEEIRKKLPVPVFWLFGKTQSGKTSLIRFLTGAESAEIGQGFRPTTRYSRQYQFPTPETPLVTFLDTRGLDEPNDGGEPLQKVLVGMLPSAYRQTLLALEETTHELQDLYARLCLPHILGYATLAASTGAIPIPWIDLLILPGIQSRMLHH